ncbi:hypothetical protein F4859DRAFT_472368 [Xylaria cf. heliscus]|nr:hypothetical protein F4859DRAFT_472368 [Xylaria cf. heliscus]
MTPYNQLRERETRLAIILPGRWNDRLRCRLINSNIDVPKVLHKALSYVWGSPHVTEVIELHGRDHDVTLNLACALRHIRNAEEPIHIWIDALVCRLNPFLWLLGVDD